MVSITQLNTQVKVSIQTGTSSTTTMFLYWECNTPLFAELLTIRLQKEMSDAISAIRKEEYEQGWKDAKAKKAKRTWFPGVFRLFFNK